MPKQTFNLRPADEFIELNKLLKITGIAQTGGHAHILIDNGEVIVNGEKESRKRRKLIKGDVVSFEQKEILIAEEFKG